MATVYLGLRLHSSKLEKITLNNVSLSDTVDSIKQTAASKGKTSADKIELVHCGVILNGSETLEEAGITSGAMIHCLPKKEEPVTVAVPLSLPEVQTLLVSLRNVAAHPNFRAFIQKLRTPEMVEKVLSSCPIARSEPAALSMLQDPELFMGLTNPDNLSKVVDRNPAVGRVAEYVTSLMTSDTTSPRRSHHVSYSMDALSDDEEMDAEQSGDSAGGSRNSGSVAFQPITPAQLAAALASATGSSSGNNGSNTRLPTSAPRSIPTTPSAATTTPFNTPAPSAGASAGPGPITHEMFSTALQNALAASASRASVPSSSSSSSSAPPSASVQIPNLDENLQLMREMGILDEDLSRQALQATNGDVQAAVNLIFAQWMADD
ncbi:ubiquitin-like protein 7 isoform X1 [Penaeus japonicus]|uniref:ubiquitin-like protein 7 isoform X1 n=1 Tax=Penaeus japonicus TaxID=27405 RepID=UPI001C7165F2|nr:ubiquitin-like protein 7 isoform X1 [Penaeus japonicus]